MTIQRAISDHLVFLSVRGLARRSCETYALQLVLFARWLAAQGIDTVADVTRDLLQQYQAHLMTRTTRTGHPLSTSAQAQAVTAIKGLFSFLARHGRILVNPAEFLDRPRKRPLAPPYDIPSVRQIAKIIERPNTSRRIGVRDRAIMEVLYSSGLRLGELRALKVWDIDLVAGLVTVVRGKGDRGRLVPLGREACRWVAAYLAGPRVVWAKRRRTDLLFITERGTRLCEVTLRRAVKRYARRAGIRNRATLHMFRHAFASHMLLGGADIRSLQMLLGHRQLSTTAIYTHLDMAALKRIHRKCHPRAKAPRRLRAPSPH